MKKLTQIIAIAAVTAAITVMSAGSNEALSLSSRSGKISKNYTKKNLSSSTQSVRSSRSGKISKNYTDKNLSSSTQSLGIGLGHNTSSRLTLCLKRAKAIYVRCMNSRDWSNLGRGFITARWKYNWEGDSCKKQYTANRRACYGNGTGGYNGTIIQ